MVKCEECGCEFNQEKSLHIHLKSHKLSVETYYRKHFPKWDLYSGEPLVFKNRDQYLESDFNSKNNFRKWAQKTSKEKVAEYCKKLLLRRKEKKKTIYPYSQVELKSVGLPPVHFLNDLFGDYYEFCENNGFEHKYNSPAALKLQDSLSKNYCIFVDTREQKPLDFIFPTQIKKLDFGDYCYENQDISGRCYIERKSLTDFIGTLNAGFKRFCKEIERAMEEDAHIVVVVENDLTTALSFQYLPYINRNTKVNADFIFHRVRYILNMYKNVQFVFANDRNECKRVVEKIFANKDIGLNYDLQYLYEHTKL